MIELPPTPEESLTHVQWLWSQNCDSNEAFNKQLGEALEHSGGDNSELESEEEDEDDEDDEYFPDEELEDILGSEKKLSGIQK